MRSGSSTSGRLPGGAISWLTIVGLGAVLLAFGALIVGGSLRDTSTAKGAANSGDLAEAYLRAQDALSREDQVEYAIEDGPVMELTDEFDAAAKDFDRSLVVLRRSGDTRDRGLAARADVAHRRYVAAIRAALVAVARGDDAAVERIDDEQLDPAQRELQAIINGTGPEYAVAQLKALDDLQRGERQELIAASVAVPLGTVLYILLVMMFVRQRRRLDAIARAEVERLDEAAHTDSLTGLLNHRALRRDLAERDATPQVMAMLDVVGLKPVNDRQGHLAGDALLQGVAAAMREEVAGAGRAYRIGGDEFAIVLPTGDEATGHSTVEAIRARITVRHPAGVRSGVATGTDAHTLLEEASDALLVARRTGKLSSVA